MNKNYNVYYCNKKNKIPLWFKYASKSSKKEISKNKIKELFIKELYLENSDLFKHKNNNDQILPKRSLEISVVLENPFETNIKIMFYKNITNMDKENIKDLIISWFLIGKNGGYQTYNFKFINQKTKWFSDDDISDGISYFLTLSYIRFDKNDCIVKCNLGVYDNIALDILINSLIGFNKKFKLIKKISIS